MTLLGKRQRVPPVHTQDKRTTHHLNEEGSFSSHTCHEKPMLTMQTKQGQQRLSSDETVTKAKGRQQHINAAKSKNNFEILSPSHPSSEVKQAHV